MRISYDKLWRLMKNNKMKKSELAAAAEISPLRSSCGFVRFFIVMLAILWKSLKKTYDYYIVELEA